MDSSNTNGRMPVLSNHVDIAPTTLGLCGIGKPEWMEGADLAHHRIDKNAAGPEPDSAYLQCVVSTGQPDTPNTPYRGLVTRDGWKYICFENRSWLQFNLNEDPYEEMNLAQLNRYRPERKKMIARLKQWAADTGDKFPDNSRHSPPNHASLSGLGSSICPRATNEKFVRRLEPARTKS